MEKVATEVRALHSVMTGELTNAPTAHSLRGRQADGRRHLRPPSGPQEASTCS